MISLLCVVHIMTLKSDITLRIVINVGLFYRNRRMTTDSSLYNGWLNVIGNDVATKLAMFWLCR